MATSYRANRIVVEVDDELLAALDAEAAARSSNLRRSTRSEVLREMITEHLMGDARKAGTTP